MWSRSKPTASAGSRARSSEVTGAAKPVRIAVVGLGTVGRWLVHAIERDVERLGERYGIALEVIAVARRDGLVHREGQRWPTALAGLEAIEFDVLAEVSQSPMSDGEPGISHMRAALRRGASVATSNKWPVAHAGVELAALAREQGLGFRAESTVMSGTPVLAALVDGLGGARPLRLRGVLNATVNFICSRVAAGATYGSALAEAETAGLAEPDSSADVEGLDSAAKVMVLSALLFGEQLSRDEVRVRGIAEVGPAEVAAALASGERIREVATLDPGAGVATVEARAVEPDDPFFALEGTANAVRLEAEPVGEVAIAGPGAGPELAGQGVYSDLIALATRRR